MFVVSCSKLIKNKLNIPVCSRVQLHSLPKIVRTKLAALMFIAGGGDVKILGIGEHASWISVTGSRRHMYTIYLNKTEINNECANV